MAAIDWPVTLPVAPLRAGNQQVLNDAVIRSEMGYGPAKLRRRTTAQIKQQPINLVLDDAERNTLDTFYISTLSQTLPFNYTDPVTGATVDARFVSPPVYREVSCTHWSCSMVFEFLP